jgi:hypothetical protein
MKVDNTSFVPWNDKRDSVRISTNETFGVGSVWVVDIWHAPFGVSVFVLFFFLKKIWIGWVDIEMRTMFSAQYGLRCGHFLLGLLGRPVGEYTHFSFKWKGNLILYREIDIFEGVNLSPSSQMGLHTTAGCNQVSPNQTSNIVNGTNCEGGAGCIVTNNSPASYGQEFADAQGGVFVAELAESGVS